MSKAYEETSVAVAKSKEQIEQLLKKFSVQTVRFTSYLSYATLEFVRKEKDGRMVPYRIDVKPKVKDFARSPGREMDRAERQVWRVVYWWIKAKIEAIDFGLVEFQEDFLPYLLITDGEGRRATVAEVLSQRLDGMLTSPDDPFVGLQRALPPGGA